jgi:ELWxxDGT repeat protein
MRQLVWASCLLVSCAQPLPSERAFDQSQQPLAAQPIPRLNNFDASYPGLNPNGFFSEAGRVYFIGTGLGAGDELWTTDGTTSGTHLVRDIQPGLGSANIGHHASLGARTFFSAAEASIGNELWSTDGTRAGTNFVVDWAPGTSPGALDSTGNGGWPTLGGNFYFGGRSGHLTRCDGTALGTQEVSAVDWTRSYDYSIPTVFNGEIYGAATGGFSQGYELYAYSPFDGGTRLVAELNSGSSSTYPSVLTPTANQLFFAGRGPSSDYFLYVTDGFTRPLNLGRIQGVSVSQPGCEMLPVDAGVVVRANGPFPTFVAPTQLYRADGSDAGIQLVSNLYPGSDSWPGAFTHLNGLIYFLATNNAGTQVWVTDLTSANTRRLTRVPAMIDSPGNNYSHKPLLVPLQGRIYFCGNVTGVGSNSALLQLDESVDGGFDVIYPFDTCNELYAMSPTQLLISASATPASGKQLWVSDGTAAGTRMLYGLPPELHSAGNELLAGPVYSLPPQFGALRGGVVFSGFDGHDKFRPWFTDGVSSTLLSDAGEAPSGFVTSGTRTFFAAVGHNPLTQQQLWVSDGTSSGTRAVADFVDQPVTHLSPIDGGVLFASSGYLWSSDGTDAGTARLAAIAVFNDIVPLGPISILDGYAGSSRLWRTDGTPAGTQGVGLADGGSIYNPANFTRVGSEVYFAGSNSQFGSTTLWKTDGSDAGTLPVSPVQPVQSGAELNGKLVFAGYDNVAGTEPWVSDGTLLGTQRLLDLVPGPEDSIPSEFRASNGLVYFAAQERAHGAELWVTDGTAGGTRMVIDLMPGVLGSYPHSIFPAGAGVVFAASDGVRGVELWYSEGTAASTVLLSDLFAGDPSSNPTAFALSGGKIFFLADDGTGQNVFVIGVPDAGVAIDAGTPLDAGAPVIDAGTIDAGLVDAGFADAGTIDAGVVDAGQIDAGPADGGETDAGEIDSGVADSGEPDAGEIDAGATPHDGGSIADAGSPPEVRGACGCGSTSAEGLLALVLLVRRLRLRARPVLIVRA